MLIYYNPTSGALLYTLSQSNGLKPPPAGDWIEVEDQVLELHQWRVENGALVPLPGIALQVWRETAECSQAQIRLALRQMGLLALIEGLVAADPDAAIVWQFAQVIKRLSPFINALKGDLFTEEQVDDIFRYAMGITV